LVSLFSVVVMGLYLALHPALYREWLIALFPPIHRDLVRDVLSDCAGSLRAYIVGLLLTMTFLGTLTALGLYFLDVPYALTFGVFTWPRDDRSVLRDTAGDDTAGAVRPHRAEGWLARTVGDRRRRHRCT
jgi:hypothetical protein